MTNSLSIPAGGHTEGRQNPDTLLAAVPGLLGFVPERSIVFLAFRDHRVVAATMRHDLELTRGGLPTVGMKQLFDRLGALAASYEVIGTVAVIIDDRFPPDDPRWRKIAAAVNRAFRPAGGLSAAFAMPEAVADARWHTVWRPGPTANPRPPFVRGVLDTGVLSDPNTSATALERAVSSGRRILARRSEMETMLDPEAHCSEPECCAESPVPYHHAPDDADARGLELTLAVVDRFDAGDTDLTCHELNRIAAALVSVHVRDALLGLSLTGLRPAAEDLWRTLTRRLRGPARAAAATLLGHLHYMAGEGAYAGVAFQAAHEADPDYNLANLLDTALLNGMRPRDLGGLAELAFEVSERLGAQLPPAVYEAAG
ncbi:DUF4192 domain-containing protein [Gordonia hydrophobica]|uniref:DUF4192 domain-containing protein n=1 Tax=Gordonia hydrophobica TaxID=40516 RepID=A0ABZ2U0F2_9ACTN|nr:DUF4192 domain-containing protein [Gordonia hydrophobica]MBM7367701.1 hypothetical protein [Gordonia hydrophobica]